MTDFNLTPPTTFDRPLDDLKQVLWEQVALARELKALAQETQQALQSLRQDVQSLQQLALALADTAPDSGALARAYTQRLDAVAHASGQTLPRLDLPGSGAPPSAGT